MLRIHYKYDPQGSWARGEKFASMVAWTTAPEVPGQPPRIHRAHVLPSPAAVTTVDFPYNPDEPWDADAQVHFVLETYMKSSEGIWCPEESAMGEFFLKEASGNKDPWTTIPMRAQSVVVPAKGYSLADEQHKGNLMVRLDRDTGPAIEWRPPTGWELTPANAEHINEISMEAVGRAMSPFIPPVMRTATRGRVSEPMPPTMEETRQVHAPLYGTETLGTLKGSDFWSLVPEVAAKIVQHHDNTVGGTLSPKFDDLDDYLANLLTLSLERHDMSAADFHMAAERMAAEPTEENLRLVRRAAAVLGTACTARGNMVSYIADEMYGAKSKKLQTEESFNEVGQRTGYDVDSGGVRSFSTHSAGAPIHGDMAVDMGVDVATGGAGDCEDVARDAAVHFVLWQERAITGGHDFESPLNNSARTIAQAYRFVGVLCSVLSRNLTDARKTKGGIVAIGSAEDANVVVGAHMCGLLVPASEPKRWTGRSLASRNLAGHPRTPVVDYGQQQQQNASGSATMMMDALPLLVLEGTGILHPYQLPAEHYETETEHKSAAALAVAMWQEADARMRTGMTSEEMADLMTQVAGGPSGEPTRSASSSYAARSDLTAKAKAIGRVAKAMAPFIPMHTQDKLFDNPDERVSSSFYRQVSEMYLVPTMAQLAERKARTTARHRYLACDLMYAEQVGPRHARRPTGRPTSGVALSDILRKQPWVGAWPMPEPHPAEVRATYAVFKHLAPPGALNLGHQEEAQEQMAKASQWAREFRGIASPKPSARRAMRQAVPTHKMVHGFARAQSMTSERVAMVARAIRDNPHVVGASLRLERSTHHLATLRLDAVVDTSGGGLRKLAQELRSTIAAKSRVVASSHRHEAMPADGRNRPRRVQADDGYVLMDRVMDARDCYAASTRDLLPAYWHEVPPKSKRSAQDRVLPYSTTRYFESVVAHHAALVVNYIVVSWRMFRNEDGKAPTVNNDAIVALVEQFTDWGVGIQDAPPVAWALAAETSVEAGFDEPSSYWVQNLIRDHVVYLKGIIDLSWSRMFRKTPRSQRAKDTEMRSDFVWDLRGDHRKALIGFWQDLLSESPEAESNFEAMWDAHVQCTLDAIDSVGGTISRGTALVRFGTETPEFAKAATACVRQAAQLGRLIDKAFYSADAGNGAEEGRAIEDFP